MDWMVVTRLVVQSWTWHREQAGYEGGHEAGHVPST